MRFHGILGWALAAGLAWPAAAAAQDTGGGAPLDGRYVAEGAVQDCNTPYFTIAGDDLTFGDGPAWGYRRSGQILMVEPPADCTECERAPFDILDSGMLQRFVEGTVERFVNCDAVPLDTSAALPEPSREPATESWTVRPTDQGAEAYFSTGRSTLVVGCRVGPATVYVRYFPEENFEFPEVGTPRGPVNVLVNTVHPQFGAYTSAFAFETAMLDDLRYYEGAWSSGDPFFRREVAFRLIAGLRTGNAVTLTSATVEQDGGARSYEDEMPLAGSSAAIGEAMGAGGCAGFLAATEDAIREGRVE